MRVLLDECLTGRLAQHLPGYEVETVRRAGWMGIKNGRLLRLIAESGRFGVFVTMDKSLRHQQDLRNIPFAVVVLRAPSNRYEATRPHMLELSRRLPQLKAGEIVVLSPPTTART